MYLVVVSSSSSREYRERSPSPSASRPADREPFFDIEERRGKDLFFWISKKVNQDAVSVSRSKSSIGICVQVL